VLASHFERPPGGVAGSERLRCRSVKDSQDDTVQLVTSDAAKVRRLEAGAKWRHNGIRYRTTEIVALEGAPPRWRVRGVPERA
jgi:hypothetical protein